MTGSFCRTILLAVDAVWPEQEAIGRADRVIRQGNLVTFPTETVYGLGSDALNPHVEERIFWTKGRPADKPLMVHIAGPQDLETVAAQFLEKAWKLASCFWRGLLTLVLPRSQRVPKVTSGGLETVALTYARNGPLCPLIKRVVISRESRYRR